ncbi:MAG TPA: DUF2070 family protein [Thermoplasmata archaeon]|jgi:putative membrane protein
MRALRPKSVGESHAETTRMARRLFVSPSPQRMIVPILAFSAMEAFLVVYPRLDAMRVALGTIAFGVPAFLAALLTRPVAEGLGGRMYLRRSFLLVFVGLIVLGAFELVAVSALSVYAVFSNVPYPGGIEKVAVLGYGTILWVREVILSATSHSHHLRSLPAAALHPVLGLALLAWFAPMGLWDILVGFLVLAIFYLSAVAYTEIAKRPLLRSFGVDGLTLLRSTLDVYSEQDEVGTAELESFFDSISVSARVRVAGVGFRAGGRVKALFVAPTVHPGPMGKVSGSDLPSKLAKDLADLTPNILVAHGPTTHDENPATTAELRKVSDAVRRLLGAADYAPQAGRACRSVFGRATALAQAFEDLVLIVASFAPNPTDDIDSATGYAAVQEAKLLGARDAVFVDAHNCLEPGAGLALFGSQASHEIIQAAKAATEAGLAAPKGMVRVGYGARRGLCTPEEGLGARGIEALVVEVDGQRTGYVLFDGNNMVPGLRDAIRERIAGFVHESEAMTTDNHSVNLTMDGFNAVGAVLKKAAILEHAEAAVQEAVANLGPVEAAPFAGDIADVRVFGPQTAARLTTSINSTMSVLRPALYVTVSGAVALAALALLIL